MQQINCFKLEHAICKCIMRKLYLITYCLFNNPVHKTFRSNLNKFKNDVVHRLQNTEEEI